jgi:hypothetical protein
MSGQRWILTFSSKLYTPAEREKREMKKGKEEKALLSSCAAASYQSIIHSSGAVTHRHRAVTCCVAGRFVTLLSTFMLGLKPSQACVVILQDGSIHKALHVFLQYEQPPLRPQCLNFCHNVNNYLPVPTLIPHHDAAPNSIRQKADSRVLHTSGYVLELFHRPITTYTLSASG